MFSEVCWAKEQVCVGFQICDPNSFRAEGGGGFTIYENIIGINAKKQEHLTLLYDKVLNDQNFNCF